VKRETVANRPFSSQVYQLLTTCFTQKSLPRAKTNLPFSVNRPALTSLPLPLHHVGHPNPVPTPRTISHHFHQWTSRLCLSRPSPATALRQRPLHAKHSRTRYGWPPWRRHLGRTAVGVNRHIYRKLINSWRTLFYHLKTVKIVILGRTAARFRRFPTASLT
jgi:hypothetical protein